MLTVALTIREQHIHNVDIRYCPSVCLSGFFLRLFFDKCTFAPFILLKSCSTKGTESQLFVLLIQFNKHFLQPPKGPKCRCHNVLTISCIALHSINGAAVEETSQLELVRGARRSRAPQTNTHVNGDPLSVFDDSTLSELSDDEGRYICSMLF